MASSEEREGARVVGESFWHLVNQIGSTCA